MKKYVYNLARIVGFIGLVCFGILNFPGQVKAETIWQDVVISSSTIEIPSSSDGNMLICVSSRVVQSTNIKVDNVYGSVLYDNYGSIVYWQNVTSGVHSFYSTPLEVFNCRLISGLDLTVPYELVETRSTPNNQEYNYLIDSPSFSSNNFALLMGVYAAGYHIDLSYTGGLKVMTGESSYNYTSTYIYHFVDYSVVNNLLVGSCSDYSEKDYVLIKFNPSAPPVVPDSQTGVWGYLNFQSKYQCNRGDSCVFRFFYNQEYIPEDTNEIRLSYGVYPNITVVATSTIEDFSLIGKSDGRSFISFDIASTTPRGTYEYFINAEADDDSWVFSSPIYLEVFNEDEYLNPYPEMEEFEMWGSEWYFKLLSIFPFNIPTSFIIAWNNSATAELPEDLEFLDMADELGNFNASFPKQWLGTPADMEFTLFGYDKIVNGSSRMIFLLENFKKFTTFLQWLMFVWGFWGFAKLVIDNLNVSVTESGSENIHSSVSHSERVDFLGRSSHSNSYTKARSRNTYRSKNIRF